MLLQSLKQNAVQTTYTFSAAKGALCLYPQHFTLALYSLQDHVLLDWIGLDWIICLELSQLVLCSVLST